MALDLGVTYAGQIDPDSASYPFGTPRNVTVPGDGLGTPLEKAWMQDVYGLLQGLLDEASIVPSGTADNAVTSQYRDALKIILASAAEFDLGAKDAPARATEFIKIAGNYLPQLYLSGYTQLWVSGSIIIAGGGSARNGANTADLVTNNADSKVFNSTWVAGDGNGGMAAGALPLVTGWHHLFTIQKPDGSRDWIWDDNSSGTNIFIDPNVVAAGYSDSSLERRVGHTFYDGAAVPEFISDGDRSRRFMWDTAFQDVSVADVNHLARDLLTITHAPPNSLATLSFFADANSSQKWIITEAGQADVAAGASAFTMGRGSNDDTVNVHGRWRVGANSEIFIRRETGSGSTPMQVICHGWEDGPEIA